MADNEMITRDCQETWKAFCRFTTIGTVGVILVLALMAYFLV